MTWKQLLSTPLKNSWGWPTQKCLWVQVHLRLQVVRILASFCTPPDRNSSGHRSAVKVGRAVSLWSKTLGEWHGRPAAGQACGRSGLRSRAVRVLGLHSRAGRMVCLPVPGGFHIYKFHGLTRTKTHTGQFNSGFSWHCNWTIVNW